MLKDVELMLLEQLEYLNREVTETAGVFPGSWEGRSVGEILAVFDEDALRRLAEKKDEEVGTLISGREWSVLIPAIRKNERLSKLVCVGRTEPDTQQKAEKTQASGPENAPGTAGSPAIKPENVPETAGSPAINPENAPETAGSPAIKPENALDSAGLPENRPEDDPEAVYATCYLADDGKAYVAFRGTSSGFEWYDDVDGLHGSDTVCQEAALACLESLPFDDITVIGHSKGGNKAQYLAIVSEKVTRCISMDGQGFSREFLEKYAEKIQAKAGSVRNYSLSRDYVHILMYPIPGAEQIYCKGGQRHHGYFAHSSAGFFQYDESEPFRLMLDETGLPYFLQTEENQGMHYLHGFTCFALATMAANMKELMIVYIGNILALSMTGDYVVTEGEKVYDHGKLADYIFSDQRTAAFFLAYLLKYVDICRFSEEQFTALLGAMGVKGFYENLLGAADRRRQKGFYKQGSSLLVFFLRQLKDGRVDPILEEMFEVAAKQVFRKNALKGLDGAFNVRKFWRDTERAFGRIRVADPEKAIADYHRD